MGHVTFLAADMGVASSSLCPERQPPDSSLTNSKFILSLGIALTVLGLAAGMSSMDAAAQSDDAPALEGDIDIGVIYPLTGDLAERGTHRLAGAELGAADFNEYLASMGMDWRLVLNVEDTETKPTASLEKAQLLNSKGVKLIIGPAGSGNVLSVKPYADQNNMLILSCCSTSPTLAIPGDSVFRLAPDDSVQGWPWPG